MQGIARTTKNTKQRFLYQYLIDKNQFSTKKARWSRLAFSTIILFWIRVKWKPFIWRWTCKHIYLIHDTWSPP